VKDPSGLIPGWGSNLWSAAKDFVTRKVEQIGGHVNLGPLVTVSTTAPEMPVGTEASLTVNGEKVVTVSAECTVGVTTTADARGPLFEWRGKIGAKFPKLMKTPYIGKFFAAEKGASGQFGDLSATPTGEVFGNSGDRSPGQMQQILDSIDHNN